MNSGGLDPDQYGVAVPRKKSKEIEKERCNEKMLIFRINNSLPGSMSVMPPGQCMYLKIYLYLFY